MNKPQTAERLVKEIFILISFFPLQNSEDQKNPLRLQFSCNYKLKMKETPSSKATVCCHAQLFYPPLFAKDLLVATQSPTHVIFFKKQPLISVTLIDHFQNCPVKQTTTGRRLSLFCHFLSLFLCWSPTKHPVPHLRQ